MKRAVVAAALVTVGCSSSVSGQPAPQPQPVPANLAYVDTRATGDAVAGVKKAVETAFSYDSAKPDEVTRNEQEYLTGAARAQFDKTFAEVRTTPVTTQTQVLETALAELRPDRAQVLVVAAQHSSRPDGATNQATAVMLLTAVPAKGHWQLQDMNFDPRGQLVSPDGSSLGPASARDTAVAAAHRDGGVLLTVDPQNADAGYDGWEKVAAEPLLTQFRTDRTQTLDHIRKSGTKATFSPNSTAALTDISPDGTRASALLAALVTTTGAQQAERRLPIHLDLVRSGTEWKVSGMKVVAAQGS
ncbi:hypothetical protein [Amycolatopsis jejuensis]|uniref:hypothetical protein n=1 Tax=Amycolatopsis jejuensis TaxID=330084 RepID=UPI001FE1A95B|nr:hypothetical protein [Amycolatopsis jejuensis]